MLETTHTETTKGRFHSFSLILGAGRTQPVSALKTNKHHRRVAVSPCLSLIVLPSSLSLLPDWRVTVHAFPLCTTGFLIARCSSQMILHTRCHTLEERLDKLSKASDCCRRQIGLSVGLNTIQCVVSLTHLTPQDNLAR